MSGMDDFIRDYARKGFLRDLLFNDITSVKDIWELQKKLNIEHLPNTVMVVTIDNYYSDTVNKSEIQKQAIRIRVYECLKRFAEKFDALVVNMEENLLAVLFWIEKDKASEVEYSMNTGACLKEQVEKETGISVSIGIGRRYKDILDLHISYKEALSACHHKFFLGKSQVIHIDNALPFSEDLGLYSVEVESQLSVRVLACDEEGAYNILRELMGDTLQQKAINPLTMKTRLIEIITTLMRVSVEAGADQENLAVLSGKCVEGILKSDTMTALQSLMQQAIKGIIQEVYQGRKRMNLEVFEKALNYIRDNFNRPITLEEVSDHVHISPYYFSHGFKNFTGMNFIDYVTKLRIDEAKKLLLTTDMNVGDIGKQVGYYDPNYFGRVFKNLVGMPPSKFKVSKKVRLDRIFSEG
ncbi:helix-turn-helix domain-containing protein [Biomaibacter acetigenes]|uniref:Helix-turn-helix domain-containing protein n=2 Tax=Biomaibacter acetigenes TaxID=2316383 RepID=A0A3G2R3F9_9FIRM|nr:helix-turn-helix domain-containing protein [Biomaibacter acetigenes]RKL63188.1 AraC family transcriptional regulator [Thermoanaerobacteraceae bacterium SP2]